MPRCPAKFAVFSFNPMNQIKGNRRRPGVRIKFGDKGNWMIEIEIVPSEADDKAQEARQLLVSLRQTYDLGAWEFTRRVRISPMEIPHSHPVLTLNVRRVEVPDAFLATYLHEQIHWGLSLHFTQTINSLVPEFENRYPDLHCGEPGEARNSFSSYLHIIVNWLEVHALSQYIGREKAIEYALQSPVYGKIYQLVIKEWKEIETVLTQYEILPFPKAA